MNQRPAAPQQPPQLTPEELALEQEALGAVEPASFDGVEMVTPDEISKKLRKEQKEQDAERLEQKLELIAQVQVDELVRSPEARKNLRDYVPDILALVKGGLSTLASEGYKRYIKLGTIDERLESFLFGLALKLRDRWLKKKDAKQEAMNRVLESDMQAEQKAEQALREAKLELQNLLDDNPDGLDEDGELAREKIQRIIDERRRKHGEATQRLNNSYAQLELEFRKNNITDKSNTAEIQKRLDKIKATCEQDIASMRDHLGVAMHENADKILTEAHEKFQQKLVEVGHEFQRQADLLEQHGPSLPDDQLKDRKKELRDLQRVYLVLDKAIDDIEISLKASREVLADVEDVRKHYDHIVENYTKPLDQRQPEVVRFQISPWAALARNLRAGMQETFAKAFLGDDELPEDFIMLEDDERPQPIVPPPLPTTPTPPPIPATPPPLPNIPTPPPIPQQPTPPNQPVNPPAQPNPQPAQPPRGPQFPVWRDMAQPQTALTPEQQQERAKLDEDFGKFQKPFTPIVQFLDLYQELEGDLGITQNEANSRTQMEEKWVELRSNNQQRFYDAVRNFPLQLSATLNKFKFKSDTAKSYGMEEQIAAIDEFFRDPTKYKPEYGQAHIITSLESFLELKTLISKLFVTARVVFGEQFDRSLIASRNRIERETVRKAKTAKERARAAKDAAKKVQKEADEERIEREAEERRIQEELDEEDRVQREATERSQQDERDRLEAERKAAEDIELREKYDADKLILEKLKTGLLVPFWDDSEPYFSEIESRSGWNSLSIINPDENARINSEIPTSFFEEFTKKKNPLVFVSKVAADLNIMKKQKLIVEFLRDDHKFTMRGGKKFLASFDAFEEFRTLVRDYVKAVKKFPDTYPAPATNPPNPTTP